jgi:hypothetical protein
MRSDFAFAAPQKSSCRLLTTWRKACSVSLRGFGRVRLRALSSITRPQKPVAPYLYLVASRQVTALGGATARLCSELDPAAAAMLHFLSRRIDFWWGSSQTCGPRPNSIRVSHSRTIDCGLVRLDRAGGKPSTNGARVIAANTVDMKLMSVELGIRRE